MLLDERYDKLRSDIRDFVDNEIMPIANEQDEKQILRGETIDKLIKKGYLSSMIPEVYGGSDLDSVSLAILNEEIGRACSSTRSLLTVHGMCALGILKWGSKDLKNRYLRDLASGKKIGAFALSEPAVGSDAKAIETTAKLDGDYYVLSGRKKWITMAQIADVFIIFANSDGKVTAFVVDKNTNGMSVSPMKDLLGCRASMLGEIILDSCLVRKENVIGIEGAGLSHVAQTCLDYGRFSVANGCVGIAQACLEESINYSKNRIQFHEPLRKNQLIQKMITEMVVNIKAARLLCLNAAMLKDNLDPDSIMETCNAKYFASTMLNKITSDAIQIHGGNGVSKEYNVSRYFRDGKINEIIEGSTQIQEVLISKYSYQCY